MKVIVLLQANESLWRSLRYLSAYYDQRYLRSVDRAIREKISWLADHSGAGQFETELEWTNAGYRRLIVRDFKIVVRIDDDTIVVNDIFDSRRGIRKG